MARDLRTETSAFDRPEVELEVVETTVFQTQSGFLVAQAKDVDSGRKSFTSIHHEKATKH